MNEGMGVPESATKAGTQSQNRQDSETVGLRDGVLGPLVQAAKNFAIASVAAAVKPDLIGNIAQQGKQEERERERERRNITDINETRERRSESSQTLPASGEKQVTQADVVQLAELDAQEKAQKIAEIEKQLAQEAAKTQPAKVPEQKTA